MIINKQNRCRSYACLWFHILEFERWHTLMSQVHILWLLQFLLAHQVAKSLDFIFCLWEAPSLLRFKSFWSHLPLELFSLGSKSLFRLRQAEQLTGWINASVHQDTAQHLSNARQASWMLAMMQVIFSSEFSLFIRFSCHQILSRPTATPCQCSYKMFQVSASHWDPEEKAAQVWPLHRKGGE